MPQHIAVWVHPRARQARCVWDGEVLKVWVREAPTGGAANASVCRVVAEWLNVPPSTVRLTGGRASRRKIVVVDAPVEVPEAD